MNHIIDILIKEQEENRTREITAKADKIKKLQEDGSAMMRQFLGEELYPIFEELSTDSGGNDVRFMGRDERYIGVRFTTKISDKLRLAPIVVDCGYSYVDTNTFVVNGIKYKDVQEALFAAREHYLEERKYIDDTIIYLRLRSLDFNCNRDTISKALEAKTFLDEQFPDRQEEWNKYYNEWESRYISNVERMAKEESDRDEYQNLLSAYDDKVREWSEEWKRIDAANQQAFGDLQNELNAPFTVYKVTYVLAAMGESDLIVEENYFYSLTDAPDEKGYWTTTDGRFLKISNVSCVEIIACRPTKRIAGTPHISVCGFTIFYGFGLYIDATLLQSRFQPYPEEPNSLGIEDRDVWNVKQKYGAEYFGNDE